jgi:hypothetical protein
MRVMPLFFFHFFSVARPAAEAHPASTRAPPAPPSHKKTGGSSRHATRIHAAPVDMDDGSDADSPAAASQDHSPSAVTHTRKQVQAPKMSMSSYRCVHAGREVPDDEEEVMEEDKTDQEDKDEDDIYGGVSSAVGDALGNEVGWLPTFMYLRYMLADDPNSHF